jgi:hypothetical protein
MASQEAAAEVKRRHSSELTHICPDVSPLVR